MSHADVKVVAELNKRYLGMTTKEKRYRKKGNTGNVLGGMASSLASGMNSATSMFDQIKTYTPDAAKATAFGL